MRRSFATLLALVLSLGMMLPAFAQSASSVLPSCCRRTGVHHCAMSAPQPSGDGTILVAHGTTCPFFPHVLAAAHVFPAGLAIPGRTSQELAPRAEDVHLEHPALIDRLLQHEPGRGPPVDLRA